MDTRRLLQAAAISFGIALVLGSVIDDRSKARAGAREPAAESQAQAVVWGCRARDDCGSPLKAGLRITFTGWSCTTGFFAQATDTRKVYVITAGHCTSGSGLFAQWSHHGTVIGRAALDAFGDGSSADAGAIEIEDLSFANVVFSSAGSDLRPVLATKPDSAQTIGSEVCRAGGTSGWTCGHIAAVDVDTRVAGKHIRHTWWTDFPSAAGDSGGPIVDRAGHLLGIVIATTPTQSVYSTVDSVARELDVRPCLDATCS
jgi:hypothetical protein